MHVRVRKNTVIDIYNLAFAYKLFGRPYCETCWNVKVANYNGRLSTTVLVKGACNPLSAGIAVSHIRRSEEWLL